MIHDSVFSILDIGTGSGCIIISLAKKLIGLRAYGSTSFSASDISLSALNVARKNAKKLIGLFTPPESKAGQAYKLISFYYSDLFANPRLHTEYDLIIANLPYVPKPAKSERLKAKGIDFEPQDSIFAGDNGAEIIKKFLVEAKKYLNADGQIILELDPRNAADIQKFARKEYPTAKIELKKDLAGLDRYLILD